MSQPLRQFKTRETFRFLFGWFFFFMSILCPYPCFLNFTCPFLSFLSCFELRISLSSDYTTSKRGFFFLSRLSPLGISAFPEKRDRNTFKSNRISQTFPFNQYRIILANLFKIIRWNVRTSHVSINIYRLNFYSIIFHTRARRVHLDRK